MEQDGPSGRVRGEGRVRRCEDVKLGRAGAALGNVNYLAVVDLERRPSVAWAPDDAVVRVVGHDGELGGG